MGSRVRQVRQQLGLASALALCALLSGAVSGSTAEGISARPPEPEFRLARLAYAGNYNDRGGRSWTTDAPEAEYHLSQGIRRLTRINTIDPDRDEIVYPVLPFDPTQPLNPELFTHPFLYAVEVGRWYLDEEETKMLREYLERGGFLMVDDFHGSEQWEGFMESFQRVFPDREVRDIPEDHEVFHVLYDVGEQVHNKTQVAGVAALQSGVTYEQDGYEPKWRGVFDDNGRLMVAINFNMDLGDSWEHADTPGYPQPLTALGYRFAISYALYSMTH